MIRYRTLDIDRVQMYVGEPFVIDVEDTLGTIIINQPKMGEIIHYGIEKFFANLNIFTSTTTSYKVMLWDAGIDWNDITDFELFITLYKSLDPEACKLLFGDLNFQKFELMKKKIEDKEVLVLVNKEANVEINELVYQYIHQYLQFAFNITPEEQIIKNSMLKKMKISKERAAMEINKKKMENGEDKTSSIQSVISACVNHPGFKYNLSEVMNLRICEFYDSVKRLQIYENTTAMLKGMYSGMIDSSKIDPNSYNFMKDF